MLEAVFEYRTLIGKCELGYGLELSEIARVEQIEREYAPKGERRHGRRFRRAAVTIDAVIRGDRIHDPVQIVELGPGGLVIRRAPFIARGEEVEIMIEYGQYSFRFKAQGVWLKEDGEDYKVGLALIGMPVCLHNVRLSRHEVDVIDRIVAAAA